MTIGGMTVEARRGVGALNFVRGATGPLIGLILLCVFLSVATETFLSLRNFLNVLDQVTVLGVMAVGMTLVILIGGIDLSVGSVLALSGMVMGYLGNNLGWPFGVAIVAALIASALCGVTSGFMVTRLNMPAFIATLAMMSITRGVATIITDGEQIVSFPDWFSNLAIIRHFGFLTVTVAVMIAIVVIAWIVLTYRAAGRALYAIGGSAGGREARRRQRAQGDTDRLHALRVGRWPCGRDPLGAPQLRSAELRHRLRARHDRGGRDWRRELPGASAASEAPWSAC